MSKPTRTFWRRFNHTPLRDLIRGRVSGRLDMRALLEDCNLPQDATDCVRRVVKRTRLWPLEKFDVAGELIAHFHDGLEAGTSVEQLIDSFGDEKKTARLIRRAKIRQRPLLWHVMRWCSLSIACLIGFYLLLTVYYFTGSPTMSVDYLAKLNARAAAVPEDQRAWPLYRTALVELKVMDEDVSKLLRTTHYPDGPRWDEMVEFLEKHEAAVEQIRQAAALPGLGFWSGTIGAEEGQVPSGKHPTQAVTDDPHYLDTALIGALLPQLGHIRQMGKLLLADSELALSQGDGERAYRDLVAILGLARHARETPTVINDLVAVSLYNGFEFRLLCNILTQKPELLSDEQLRDLAHRLAALDDEPIIRLEGERMMFYDMVQRMYTDNGDGDGRMTHEGMKVFGALVDDSFFSLDSAPEALFVVASPSALLVSASRREMVDKYDQMMDQLEVAFHQSMRELPSVGVEKQIIGWSNMERIRYHLISVMMPALEVSRVVQERFLGHLEGATLGIALELYRREHGRWPDSLEELAPAYVPALPVDRITGGPLQYRIVDDQPIIYSLGADRDDDGGRIPVDDAGDPSNRLAADWLTPQELSGEDHDGDWMLWPPAQ